MKFLDNLDLASNQLLNAVAQVLAADPGAPVAGQFYFNSGDGTFRYWSGSAWVSAAAGSGTVTTVSVGNLAPLFTAAVATPTTTPAITYTLSNQNANAVFAGPTSGGAAAPTFRALVLADLPALTHTAITDFIATVETVRLDQMAQPAAAVLMNGQLLSNLATPVSGTDAATKGYVDNAVQGLTQKPTARAATAAALPANTYANGASGVGATLTGNANGALVVDGVNVAAGDVVLIKNEATSGHNGVYVVTQPGTGATPYILTRHADMDTAAEFDGAFVPVDQEGTFNANSLWLLNNEGPVTVGATGLTFIQLNKGTDLAAGTGISISGNTVSIAPSYAGQATITTLGVIGAGTWQGAAVGIAFGGTGAATAQAARANLAAAGKYSALIGDGVTTAIAITQATHGLAANGQMLVAVYDAGTGNQVQPDTSINNANGTVTLTFATAPAANAYRVVIIG